MAVAAVAVAGIALAGCSSDGGTATASSTTSSRPTGTVRPSTTTTAFLGGELSGTAGGATWRVLATDGGTSDGLPLRCLALAWDTDTPGLDRTCTGASRVAVVNEVGRSTAPDGSTTVHVGYVGPDVTDVVVVVDGTDYAATVSGPLFAVALPAGAQTSQIRYTQSGETHPCRLAASGSGTTSGPGTTAPATVTIRCL